MSFSNFATSAVMALSLVAIPTLASASPAASRLSVTAPMSAVSARTGAHAVRGKKMVGGGIIIAVLAAAAVIGGIVIAADSNKKTATSL
jgi:hypothetical protein